MRGILYAQFKLLVRKPATFLIMTLFIIIFSLILGGNVGPSSSYVPVTFQMDKSESESLLDKLEEYEAQNFKQTEQAELIKAVREGDAKIGVIFQDDSFEYVIAADLPEHLLVKQNVEKAYSEFLQDKTLRETAQVDSEAVINELNRPFYTIDTKSFHGENSWVYDSQLQTLFGFSVFFVIYTIAFNVINLLIAKQNGIWDRFILSPAKKWQMYLGILIYAFVLGYIQITIVFGVFQYIVGVEFYGGFGKTLIVLLPYVLAIVALSVFLAGISKNIQTFNALVPLISVSIAMIGGAYWPIEIVSNNILLTLAKIDPIYHVMEAFKEVTIYGEGLASAVLPMSILLLMSVVLMGIGLNLMERRE